MGSVNKSPEKRKIDALHTTRLLTQVPPHSCECCNSARACVAHGVTRTLSRMSASCCSGIKSAPASPKTRSHLLAHPRGEHLGSCSPLSFSHSLLRLREDQFMPSSRRSSLPRSLGQPVQSEIRAPLPPPAGVASAPATPRTSVYSRACLIRRATAGAAVLSLRIMAASVAVASIA